MKGGLNSRGDLEQALEMHHKTKSEFEVRYNEAHARIEHAVKTLDGRYYTIMETANIVRIEHSMKKVKHRRLVTQIDAAK